MFLRDDSEAEPWLVIIQCDSGHQNYDLISCARYRIYEEAIRSKNKNRIHGRHDVTHVLFVIRLPQQEVKSQFVGFQGDPWISVHIDDLRKSSEKTVIPEQALTATISELFIGQIEETLTPDQELTETIEDKSLLGESDSLIDSDPEEEMVTEPLDQPQETESDMSDPDQMEFSDKDSLQLESLGHSEGEDSFMQYTSPEHVYKDSAAVSSWQTSSVSTDEIGLAVKTKLSTTILTQGVINLQEQGGMSDVVPSDSYTTDEEEKITLSSSLEPVTPMMQHVPSIGEEDVLGTNTTTSVPAILTPISDYSKSMSNSEVSILGDNVGLSESIDESMNTPDEEPVVIPKPVPLDVVDPTQHKETDITILRLDEGNQEPSRMKEQFSFHPQHRRLVGCIQAAVSTLKDPDKDRAMPRIQKLMTLIPKNPPTSLGILSLLESVLYEDCSTRSSMYTIIALFPWSGIYFIVCDCANVVNYLLYYQLFRTCR